MSVRNTLPFATVPEWLLDTASSRAVHLYAILVRYADRQGQAFPSRRTLARRLSCSIDSVDRALRELVAIGALEVGTRVREDGSQTSNEYVLRPGSRTDAAPPLGTDAEGTAAPVRPQEREPLELEPVERENTLAASAAHRDPIWDVFVASYGEPTRLNRGAWNTAAATLREYEANPAELEAFILGVRGTANAWAAITPLAAAKHFGSRAVLMAEARPAKRDRAAELMAQARKAQ